MRLFKPRPRPEPGEIVLVIGLGNPGPEYEETRHNVGFLVVDEMAARLGVAFKDAGHCSLADNGSLYDRRVILAKPRTYMNRSGGAVQGLLKAHGLEPADLLVVHDDLDIEFGKVRLKRTGGDGGQRGIRSIIASLGGGGEGGGGGFFPHPGGDRPRDRTGKRGRLRPEPVHPP